MQTSQLVRRNLAYFWRTNLAVVLGVATAVAVLAGALLVGDSVRASLRDLFLQRLGNTTHVITAPGFFREHLAADILNDSRFAAAGFSGTCPLVALEGTVSHDASKSRGSGIRVYGVDERFWKFHGVEVSTANPGDVLVSESLATELGAGVDDSLLIRVEKFSEIPVESLHSRKDDLGTTLRLTIRKVLAAREMGEFSIQPQQTGVRAVFVPLQALQTELEQQGKANLILIAENPGNDEGGVNARRSSLEQILKERASLEDYGIKLRVLNDQQTLSIESSAGFIPAAMAARIESTGAPYLSYLINSVRRDDGREIPYSIVTGVGGELLEIMQHDPWGHRAGCDASDGEGGVPVTANLPPIILNEWAGSDLQVKLGERVTLDYYVWLEEGKLATRSAEFRVACIVPIEGFAADRDLVPNYPGITESETLGDWDPPFPIDLKRIRPQDEDYWRKYRTTPKGFIPLGVGQDLWQTRFGRFTSLRLGTRRGQTLAEAHQALEQSLREKLDPLLAGLAIVPVRAQGLEASRGATDFGEYFLYFSFFLVISALLLMALFFKLGVEQRVREIGVLQAMGFPAARVRKIFLGEGIVLALIGSVLGVAGALAYGKLIMFGLRTWWVDAVGTTSLALHISPVSLLVGALGGIVAAIVCVILTLRRLGKQSTRSLLTGLPERKDARTGRRRDAETGRRGDAGIILPRPRVSVSPRLLIALALTLLGVILLLLASFQVIGQTPGFFGGGTLMLVGFLVLQSAWLRSENAKPIQGGGWWPLTRLGFRNATSHPGRSVLCIALIASAAFIIVAVDAFRHREGTTALERKSGSGGFPLLAESLLPIAHDPNSSAGQEALNLANDPSSPLSGVSFERFRVRPGDDASCLNLYQPRNPKIVAPREEFLQSNRFAFANSIASSDEEKTNPWLLLKRQFADGAIPFVADANSATYVLHVKLGEDFVLPEGENPPRLRLVGTLANSVLQSELIISEGNFLKLFPEQEGYRLFLIDTPSLEQPGAVAASLEERLADFGFDVVPTSERLANFHRVENTYLSTFQMLGGLGLVLGTLGMAAVLLRNVLERRRELALLRAVGYNSWHFGLMVIAENTFLLVSGLLTGAVCALLAIAPVFFERGGRVPGISLGFLLLAVLVSGLTASIVATWATLRSPLLPALRAE